MAQRFVDIRTGQVVQAEPCISSIAPDGRAFHIFYPGGGKAIIRREVFNDYYKPLWPESPGAA
jgi:hypothetical protein